MGSHQLARLEESAEFRIRRFVKVDSGAVAITSSKTHIRGCPTTCSCAEGEARARARASSTSGRGDLSSRLRHVLDQFTPSTSVKRTDRIHFVDELAFYATKLDVSGVILVSNRALIYKKFT